MREEKGAGARARAKSWAARRVAPRVSNGRGMRCAHLVAILVHDMEEGELRRLDLGAGLLVDHRVLFGQPSSHLAVRHPAGVADARDARANVLVALLGPALILVDYRLRLHRDLEDVVGVDGAVGGRRRRRRRDAPRREHVPAPAVGGAEEALTVMLQGRCLGGAQQ